MTAPNVTRYKPFDQMAAAIELLHKREEAELTRQEIFRQRVSALPILSGTLVKQVQDGEPYETLTRGIAELHKRIRKMADYADVSCDQPDSNH